MVQTDGPLPKAVALMTTYNAEAFILPALEAQAAQTYANLSVLISDDASTDRTAQICEDFAARHANFRVIRQPRNLGWIGNSNALLREADGDYFYFADHDDRPGPDFVAHLVDALERNPRAVMSFSDMVRRAGAEDRGPGLIESMTLFDGVTDRVGRGVCAARGQGEIPALTTISMHGLFRASAARRIGGLRYHMAGEFGADWPWLFHLALLGDFVRVPEPLFEKYYLQTNLSLRWRYSLWHRFGVVTACIREIRRARLPLREELTIQRALVYYALQRQWRRLQNLYPNVLRP